MQSLQPSARNALLETPFDVLSADLTIPQPLWEAEIDDYVSYELLEAPRAIAFAKPNAAFTQPYVLFELSMDVEVDFTMELEMFDLLELS